MNIELEVGPFELPSNDIDNDFGSATGVCYRKLGATASIYFPNAVTDQRLQEE